MEQSLQRIACTAPTSRILRELGTSLGQFHLNGQLAGLRTMKAHSEYILEELSRNRDNRLRSYQTLGICTGAALAILLI